LRIAEKELTNRFLHYIIYYKNRYRKLYTISWKEMNHMLAVNYTNLRDNMKHYMDQVTDDYETMIVTRKNNKNVVILSEETYNNLMENVYVMGNKANYDWLMESKAQLENGHCATHELIEVDDE